MHGRYERDPLPNRAFSALGFEASHFDKLGVEDSEEGQGKLGGGGMGGGGISSTDRLSKMLVQLEKVAAMCRMSSLEIHIHIQNVFS